VPEFFSVAIMLPYDSALAEARQHLYSRSPPVEWVWRLGHGQRIDGGWFFWYRVEPVRFIRECDHSPFGGAPGFAVLDDSSIRVVGWDQLPANLSNNPSKPPIS
jgi:hypothetical protein